MKPKLLVLSGLSALLLAACVVAPAPGPYYGEAVMVAPPPAQVEYIGPRPGQGYVWIDGNWAWAGGRYVWVTGRWERSRPGYRWVPHRWDRDGRHWRERPGHWQHH
ncbi:MAG: YXWGXW repeat-containing protein [Rhodocyclaceae bacterium]|nr:YXWGXW repeat-containing protein [Rhodocyclaceae bacterium]